jgi:hypothetical protein
LEGKYTEVSTACQQGFTSTQEESEPLLLLIRGITKAAAGDYPKAESHFQAFIDAAKDDPREIDLVAKVKNWIDEPNTGRKPWDAEIMSRVVTELKENLENLSDHFIEEAGRAVAARTDGRPLPEEAKDVR